MTDHANELRRYARKIAHPAGDVPAVMLAAADEIERLAARLKATEEDRARFLVEMGRLCAQCDALRAKIEQIEKPQPVAYTLPGAHPAPSLASGDVSLISEGKTQPAPSIPEGWKLVPVEPTETMISEGSCASGLPGHHYISEDCAKQCWEYMLAATPEAKP